jgi:NAD(P)-dependent dehydrogenase (short-subunit alcohol dehydrogenase family)
MGSMISLDNKVVVITGAGSGIGRALAIQAARHGARIALSDVDEVGLAETARLSGAWTVRTDRLDVRDRAAVAAYAMSVADEFGTVNVVINNAGVALTGNVADVRTPTSSGSSTSTSGASYTGRRSSCPT